MGGLRKATLSEAMEVLQDKNLQPYLYFRNEKQYCRVMDYEWILNHDRKTSLINQEFYIELDRVPIKDNINIQAEESIMNDYKSIHIVIDVPKEDLIYKDRQRVIKDILGACEYHIVKQLKEEK